MMGAIDAVCAQALRIIGRLTEHAASGTEPLVAVSYSGLSPAGPERPPTPAMKAYVVSLAQQLGRKPPRGYASSSAVCRAFLDKHAARKRSTDAKATGIVQQGGRPERQQTSQALSPAAPVATPLSTGKPRVPKGRKTKPLLSAKPGASTADAAPIDVRLNIPFGNKETAQKLGARYRDGAWYGPAGVDLSQFRDRGWI